MKTQSHGVLEENFSALIFQLEVKEAFKLELRNRFSALETMNDENNIDGKWDNIKDCFTSAATDTL